MIFKLITSVVLSIFIVQVRSDRKLTADLNPGCNISPELCKKVVLVHVRAEGQNDTLHHVWDFTGKPSLLIALTDNNASLSVSWIDYSQGHDESVSFSSTPKYVFGITIDKLIEFNDVNNSAALDFDNNNSSYVTFWDMKNFNWQQTNVTNSNGLASLTVEATEYFGQAAEKKNGTIRIVVSAYGAQDHAEALPHLLHSGNASQLELSLDGLSTRYTNSRFGLHMITASSENKSGEVVLRDRKTMDDEHAPGIFTIVEMLTPQAKAGECGGYLQWRPVVYTSAARDITGSTDSTQYKPLPVTGPLDLLRATLLSQTLGGRLENMMVSSTNITFGGPSDGFYHKNQFAAWTMLVGYGHPPQEQFSMLVWLVLIIVLLTMLVGYGHPPQEQFSMLVWLVLIIGLGLPAVLILTGAICVAVRRLQRNKDDLFLGR